MTEMDPFDSMMGGNFARTAKFDEVGDSHAGVIVEATMEHEREYDEDNPGKGDLLYWSDKGRPTVAVTDKPVLAPRLTIQTDWRIDDRDDGRRAVTINKRLLKAALQAAVRESGAKRPELGGWIRFTRDRDGVPLKGTNKPRGWLVQYLTPEQYVADGALGSTMVEKRADDDDPFATSKG